MGGCRKKERSTWYLFKISCEQRMNSVLEKYYPDSTKYMEINGVNVPYVYTKVEEEYAALRNEIGIIDGIGYMILLVSGDGAANFLDNLSTKDIKYLNPGKISESLFLNENAEAIGIGFIINNENEFIVLIPPENADGIATWLYEKKEDDIKIVDLSEMKSLFFIEGHKSYEIIREIFDFPVETLPLRDMVMVNYNGEDICLSRIGRSGEYGYAILGNREVMEKILKICIGNFPDKGVQFCGTDALSICMLEISQPVISKEFIKEGNVFELCNQWFIQYDKEEFLGHEKLIEDFESDRKKLCIGFCAKDCSTIPSNTPIYLEDEEIGSVLYGRFSPSLKGYLGMGLVKVDYAVSGIPLTLKADSKDIVVETLSSPFVRPISWDSPME